MIKETIKETEKLSQECDSFFQYREKGWEKLFCIEEELKKLPGKPGFILCMMQRIRLSILERQSV